MKTNDKTVARKTGRWSVLFLAGAAALAGLGAAPRAASADRYDRDRDPSRFRDGRVDVRVDSGRDYRVDERRVWVEPVYRTVCDKVFVEPVYRTEVERVWCEPVYQTVCERVWCPDRFEVRDVERYERGRRVIYRERILVERGHYVNQDRRVIVTPGHWDNVERRVCVTEGHWTEVERRECVTPGHWETRVEAVAVRPEPSLRFDLRLPVRW